MFATAKLLKIGEVNNCLILLSYKCTTVILSNKATKADSVRNQPWLLYCDRVGSLAEEGEDEDLCDDYAGEHGYRVDGGIGYGRVVAGNGVVGVVQRHWVGHGSA